MSFPPKKVDLKSGPPFLVIGGSPFEKLTVWIPSLRRQAQGLHSLVKR
jgi:hypothetical protein